MNPLVFLLVSLVAVAGAVPACWWIAGPFLSRRQAGVVVRMFVLHLGVVAPPAVATAVLIPGAGAVRFPLLAGAAVLWCAGISLTEAQGVS